MGSPTDLINVGMIKDELMDKQKGTTWNCCDKINCLMKHFVDKEGLFNINLAVHFVLNCRKQYSTKDANQRDVLIYDLFKNAVVSTNGNQQNMTAATDVTEETGWFVFV